MNCEVARAGLFRRKALLLGATGRNSKLLLIISTAYLSDRLFTFRFSIVRLIFTGNLRISVKRFAFIVDFLLDLLRSMLTVDTTGKDLI